MPKKVYDRYMKRSINWKQLIGEEAEVINPSELEAIDRMHFIDGILSDYLSFKQIDEPFAKAYAKKYIEVLSELIKTYGH
tara:strand:- start:316 stop:555 length:240 start_codon:yes stop_codon:yes gene_type:complete